MRDYKRGGTRARYRANLVQRQVSSEPGSRIAGQSYQANQVRGLRGKQCRVSDEPGSEILRQVSSEPGSGSGRRVSGKPGSRIARTSGRNIRRTKFRNPGASDVGYQVEPGLRQEYQANQIQGSRGKWCRVSGEPGSGILGQVV